MNRSWPALAALLLPLAAGGDDKPPPKASPADRLAAIQKQHKEAETKFYKEVEPLPDTPEGNKKYQELFKGFDKGQGERYLAAVEIVKADPKSDGGFAALEWLLTIPRVYYVAAGKPAMDLAAKHHAANPKVGKIIAWVGYYTPHEMYPEAHVAALALIKAVAEKNPDRTARGQAVMALAWQAKNKFAMAEYKKSPDAEKLAAEAEKAFEVVKKDYADCPRLTREGSPKLGEVADQELFELRHLRVGKTAPEIEGEDLDGKKFKLSDYKGKVVMLDFWGDW